MFSHILPLRSFSSLLVSFDLHSIHFLSHVQLFSFPQHIQTISANPFISLTLTVLFSSHWRSNKSPVIKTCLFSLVMRMHLPCWKVSNSWWNKNLTFPFAIETTHFGNKIIWSAAVCFLYPSLDAIYFFPIQISWQLLSVPILFGSNNWWSQRNLFEWSCS